MAENDYWHFLHPKLLCCKEPRVTSDDHVAGVDQDWIGPAELRDRSRDLRDLRLRVGSRVAGVGNEFLDQTLFDFEPGRDDPSTLHLSQYVHGRSKISRAK